MPSQELTPCSEEPEGEHALCQMLVERGWSAADAQCVLCRRVSSRKKWYWSNECAALSCKALLFERLTKACGNGETYWPRTWVLRSVEELSSTFVDESIEDDEEVAYYVKHPRTGGGRGTWKAKDIEEAKKVALGVLKNTDAVVIQRAIAPSRLPIGPSIFELRIWSIMQGEHLFTFNTFRAKTAGLQATRMNRAVQSRESDFGQSYPWNIADEDQVRTAIGPHRYDNYTKPAIFRAIQIVHQAVLPSLTLSNDAFLFLGFDFIIRRNDATPFLIEANVKPSHRFHNLDAQFPSPIVRTMAHAALSGLADLIHNDFLPSTCSIRDNNLATKENDLVSGTLPILTSSSTSENNTQCSQEQPPPSWLAHTQSLFPQ